MKLNTIERWSMNNPVRRAHQRGPEARWIREAAGGLLTGARVLEVGCGRGVGVEILLDQLGADTVVAVDIDPAMIDRARRRLAPRPSGQVTTTVGDAVDLPVADGSVDAIVDFGAIHHVPAWRDALADARRTLRPGGLLLFEEIPRHTLDTWIMRTVTDHPREDRFARGIHRGVAAPGLRRLTAPAAARRQCVRGRRAEPEPRSVGPLTEAAACRCLVPRSDLDRR